MGSGNDILCKFYGGSAGKLFCIKHRVIWTKWRPSNARESSLLLEPAPGLFF
jgi:hypothetical protein